jgi:hypothetical protein
MRTLWPALRLRAGLAVVGGAVVAAPNDAAPRYGPVRCVQVIDAYWRIVYCFPQDGGSDKVWFAPG